MKIIEPPMITSPRPSGSERRFPNRRWAGPFPPEADSEIGAPGAGSEIGAPSEKFPGPLLDRMLTMLIIAFGGAGLFLLAKFGERYGAAIKAWLKAVLDSVLFFAAAAWLWIAGGAL